MEVLRGRGGVHHLDVVLGTQGEESLDARRAVLGTLTLVSVRQQHDHRVVLVPLVLGGHDVLVDDDLGAVDEVAELRLPQHQGLGIRVRVSVLESDGGVLGQQRVVHPELLRTGQFRQRDPHPLVGVVDESGVPLAEGAASRVLAGQTHRTALQHQRAEGQRLAGGPFDVALFVVRLGAGLELLGQLRMWREIRGIVGELGEDPIEGRPLHTRVHVRQNADGLGRLGHLGGGRRVRAGLVQGHLQLSLEIVEGLLGFFQRDVAATHEGLDVQLANAALLGDGLVHERLRVAGVVAFVVSVAAVAHHVDHDVLVESLAVFPGQAGHPHARLGVVTVHVEDGSLHHLGHVAAVQRRTRELR